MNNWTYEFMAEYHRQEILKEAEQVHLEGLAVASRGYHTRFVARTMFRFSNWMIITGKQLRKRYEMPCVDCPSPTGSFAR